MLKTITLDTPMPFEKALEQLISGRCLGIRPQGNTASFLEMFQPESMKASSTDYFLRWHGESGNAGISTTQFLDSWYPVIIDHRTLATPAPAAK